MTAKTVLTMMESVVDDGTGSSAAIPGYRVAGKTGTAQAWLRRTQGITASFIGVAPADDPRIAVAVILHNPRTSIYGGVVAAPVFSRRRRLHARAARRGALGYHRWRVGTRVLSSTARAASARDAGGFPQRCRPQVVWHRQEG